MELKKLREENLKLEQRVNLEQDEDFINMMVYLSSAKITSLHREHLKGDLYQKILEGESKGLGLKEIFGEDLKAYLDERISHYPREDRRLKDFLLFLKVFFPFLALFIFLEVLFSYLRGEEAVRLSVFTLLIALLLSLGGLLFVRRVFREVFKEKFLTGVLCMFILVAFVTLYSLGGQHLLRSQYQSRYHT